MRLKETNISVFGLGYVGAVSASCLAEMGHSVIGVDIDRKKVEMIHEGFSPIVEKDLPQLIKKNKEAGRLQATCDAESAILNSDLSLVCVATPSLENGAVDLGFIRNVCRDIGMALQIKNEFHVVCIRSTLPPGTTRNVLIPLVEEHSRKKAGVDFGVCFNPEFLRETSAVDDFFKSSRTVIGKYDEKGAQCLQAVYSDIDAPMIRTSLEIAEMTKYVDNSWHALKICFANEVGSICSELGVDSHELMEIFCQDTKLNISARYLRPGFSFGGSCLPKDVRAVNHLCRQMKIEAPLLASIMMSNMNHTERAIQLIRSFNRKKLGFLGVTFKHGTDDVRESPYLRLVETLSKEGFSVAVYDENISIPDIIGANKSFLLSHLNGISNLFRENAEDVVNHAEILVVAHNAPAYWQAISENQEEQIIIDLTSSGIKPQNVKNYYTLV